MSRLKRILLIFSALMIAVLLVGALVGCDPSKPTPSPTGGEASTVIELQNIPSCRDAAGNYIKDGLESVVLPCVWDSGYQGKHPDGYPEYWILYVYDDCPPTNEDARTVRCIMKVDKLSLPFMSAAVPTANDESLVVLTLGDSISTLGMSGGWQQEFCNHVESGPGKTCDLRNPSVPGTRCEYWPSRIASLLAEHQPDLVILACGTNNDASTSAGSDSLGTAFRQVVEAVHTWRTPAIPVVPVFIQYSDPLLAAQWVLNSEPLANDEIYRNIQYYIGAGWFPGIIDWQGIPATPDYLHDGVHPTLLGYKYMGRLAYDQIAVGLGWPVSSEPALCGLYGHRKYYPVPAFTSCL